jgi:hypothetical protein
MIARHPHREGKTAHTATVRAAEPVLGPADDTVTFFQPRGQVFVTALWLVAAAWLVGRGLLLVALIPFGVSPSAADIPALAANLLVMPLVITCVLMLLLWRRLGWLHSSMYGIEFAATGRRAIRLPWSAIATVALRHRGPFTELVITPTDPRQAVELAGRGLPPRRRHRGAEVSYLVDVGLMSPGPEALLTELHRRIPSKV